MDPGSALALARDDSSLVAGAAPLLSRLCCGAAGL